MSIFVGVDIGTSGIRAVAFSERGEALAEARAALPTHYRGDGQVEQLYSDWLTGTVQALRLLTGRLGESVKRVRGIGLTGQCPSFALIPPSGEMQQAALIYQDNRAVEQSRRLIEMYGPAAIHRRTGETPSPFYVLPKLLWLQQHRAECLQKGAAVVQPRDAVGWMLTGRLATDPTHAACTLAYDIHAGDWAWDWLKQLGLDHLHWPEVIPSCERLGEVTAETAEQTGLPEGVPVAVGGADSLCAVYGAGAMEPGMACDVSGTSTCLHLAVRHPLDLFGVNTYPHIEPGRWLAEVGINTTGAALSWLAGLFNKTHDELLVEAARVLPGADGLLFLPHLAGGERDVPTRPGAFMGLGLGHTQGHMARAVLEGVAYALRQRIELLRQSGCSVTSVVVCGGGTRSALWNQIKSDIFGLPVSALCEPDTTALGAAMTAWRMLHPDNMSVQLERIDYSPELEHRKEYAASYERFVELEERLKDSGGI